MIGSMLGGAAAAQEDCRLRLLGSDRLGPATELVRGGERVYMVAGGALLVLDVADPTRPRRIGRRELDFEIHELSLAGTTLAAAAGELGLVLFDVSDPSRLRIAGRIDTAGDAQGVASQPGLVYVADGHVSDDEEAGGLVIVDVADPRHPVVRSFFSLADWGAEDVVVRGGRAYVLEWLNGLHVLDVSDPSHPVELGFSSHSGQHLRISGDGETLFVLNQSGGHHSWTSISLLDVSDPAHLVTLSYLWADDEDDIPFFHDIAVGGGRLFVGNRWSGLRVFDVRDRTRPSLEAELPTLLGGVDLAYAGGRLYVAARGNGLVVVDVSDPAAPHVVGSAPAAAESWGVSVGEGTAAVRVATGLRLLDVRDPAHPRARSALPVPNARWHDSPLDVARAGNLVFVPDASGLRVVDTADPAHPREVGVYAAGGRGLSVAVQGRFALLGLEDFDGDGLRILDVGDPAQPVEIGSFDLYRGWSPERVLLSGTLAAAWGGGQGCVLLDLTDPATPVVASDCGPARQSGFVAIEGDYGYSVAGGLSVIDLSNPAAPEIVGTTGLGFHAGANAAATAHGRVFLSLRYGTLALVDASVPTLPVLLARRELPSETAGIDVERARVYLANRDFGLSIFSDCPLFADGFEAGNALAWSRVRR